MEPEDEDNMDPKNEGSTSKEFDDAFDEAAAEPKSEVDQAVDGDDADTDGSPDVAVVIAAEPTDKADGEDGKGAPADEPPVEEPMAEGGDEPMSDEDKQKAKSWEGRLKAREDALKQKEDALKNGAAEGSSAEEATESPAEEAKEDAGGEDIAEVEKRLTDDFGPTFISDIKALIQHCAKTEYGNASGSISDRIDEVTKAFSGAFQNMHRSAIKEAHEDVDELIESPEFISWLDSLDEEKKKLAARVIQQGAFPEVISLLNKFKTSRQAQAPAEGGEAAATEEPAPETGGEQEGDPLGDAFDAPPSSVPVRLPQKAGDGPAGSDEFDKAWEDATAG